MALYDFVCRKCNVIVEDIYGTSSRNIRQACPSCGSKMVWRPFVRTQSTKADFECEYSGQRFGSYNDLEKWARANGKTVVPAREFERNLIHRRTPEERIAANQPGLKKELEKNVYRMRHGIDLRE